MLYDGCIKTALMILELNRYKRQLFYYSRNANQHHKMSSPSFRATAPLSEVKLRSLFLFSQLAATKGSDRSQNTSALKPIDELDSPPRERLARPGFRDIKFLLLSPQGVCSNGDIEDDDG